MSQVAEDRLVIPTRCRTLVLVWVGLVLSPTPPIMILGAAIVLGVPIVAAWPLLIVMPVFVLSGLISLRTLLMLDRVPMIIDPTGVSVARAGPGRSRLLIPWEAVEAVYLYQRWGIGPFLCVRPAFDERWLPAERRERRWAEKTAAQCGAPYGPSLARAGLDAAATLHEVWRLSGGRVRVG